MVLFHLMEKGSGPSAHPSTKAAMPGVGTGHGKHKGKSEITPLQHVKNVLTNKAIETTNSEERVELAKQVIEIAHTYSDLSPEINNMLAEMTLHGSEHAQLLAELIKAGIAAGAGGAVVQQIAQNK